MRSKIKQQHEPDTFICTKIPSLSTTLNTQDFQMMLKQTDSIVLQSNPHISLTLNKLTRPLYLTEVAIYKNTQTQQLIEVIEHAQCIKKAYEYDKMVDFCIQSPGGHQNMSLCEMKEILKNKILNEDNNWKSSLLNFTFIPKPTQFLKHFNLSVTSSDLLVNKLKNNKNQFRSQHINFNENKLPVPPESIPEYIKNFKIFKKVEQYIQKRPCWLRNVLEYQLRLDGLKYEYTISELKNILKYLTYTFRDGPWKHTFCRFDYNPLIKKQSIIHQILLVKIKRKQVQDYEQKDKYIDEIDEDNNIYDPSLRQLPTKYLRIYQLCDIQDHRIQVLIKQAVSIVEVCSKDTGWFGKNQYNELLRIVKCIRQERFTQDIV